jgi:peroxiredoxin
MRGTSTTWLAILVVGGVGLVACDSGGGSGEEDVGGGTVDVGTVAPIACSKTTSCLWGESCQSHDCVIPKGANPADVAYDFVKKDETPNSPTYGKEIALSDFHGSVILLYFATSTCDACKADVQVYEGLIEQVEFKGFVGMAKMMTVLLPMSASALPDFVAPLSSPVVVDDVDTGIADHYKGSKDTVVLIDKAGYVRETYPSLEVRGGAKDKSALTQTLLDMAAEKL